MVTDAIVLAMREVPADAHLLPAGSADFIGRNAAGTENHKLATANRDKTVRTMDKLPLPGNSLRVDFGNGKSDSQRIVEVSVRPSDALLR